MALWQIGTKLSSFLSSTLKSPSSRFPLILSLPLSFSNISPVSCLPPRCCRYQFRTLSCPCTLLTARSLSLLPSFVLFVCVYLRFYVFIPSCLLSHLVFLQDIALSLSLGMTTSQFHWRMCSFTWMSDTPITIEECVNKDMIGYNIIHCLSIHLKNKFQIQMNVLVCLEICLEKERICFPGFTV
jgi:hypothetical protein